MSELSVCASGLQCRCLQICAFMFCFPQHNKVLEVANDYKVVVVSSAGNSPGGSIVEEYNVPCSRSEVICVGAIDKNGMRKNYSHYGPYVDIWAPAGYVSTVNQDSYHRPNDNDDYGMDELSMFDGTSCATPWVAGIVAMMKALNRDLKTDEVRTILQATAHSSIDPLVTPGYVDALAALKMAKPNLPPTVVITEPSARTGYGQVTFSATVDDPELLLFNPWEGDPFELTVVFSSNLEGQLCQNTYAGTTFSCAGALSQLGKHTIHALVTDPFGAQGTDTLELEVVNTPPSARITYPLSRETYLGSQTVTFTGEAYDLEQSNTDILLFWESSIDGNLGSGPSLSTTLTLGTHTITLTAEDENGLTGTDSITISVIVSDGRPIVTILSPSNLQSFNSPVTFRGQAEDPEDGMLTGPNLVWTSDKSPYNLGTGTQVTVDDLQGLDCSCNDSGCGFATHTIILTATDSDWNTGSASIKILVGRIC